jgi:hypothetical protein
MNRTIPSGEMAGIPLSEGWPQCRIKASYPGGRLSRPETMTGFFNHHEIGGSEVGRTGQMSVGNGWRLGRSKGNEPAAEGGNGGRLI